MYYGYEYSYDGEQERIQQVPTNTKDCHYNIWYDDIKVGKVVSQESFNTTFESLREQIVAKESNKNICQGQLNNITNVTKHTLVEYDVTYYKEPEVTEYILDRNEEYTTVLFSNAEVSVYGTSLLQVNEEIIVAGLNESVVASIQGSTIQKYQYDDYGNTSDIKKGHGYNGEMKDETGLIYLRARYYDPSIARFIQIDNNYVGEQKEVVTQNRYTYTLNNPYKYVDRDGNSPMTTIISNVRKPTIVLDGKTVSVGSLSKAQLSRYFGGQKILNYSTREINDIMEGWPNTQRKYVMDLRSEANKNNYAKKPYGPKGNTPSNPGPTNPGPGTTKPGKRPDKPTAKVDCPVLRFDGKNYSNQIDCKVNGNTYTHSKMFSAKTSYIENVDIKFYFYYFVFIQATYNHNTYLAQKNVSVSVFLYAVENSSGIIENVKFNSIVSGYDLIVTNVNFNLKIARSVDMEFGEGAGGTSVSPDLPCKITTCPKTFRFTPYEYYPSAPENLMNQISMQNSGMLGGWK